MNTHRHRVPFVRTSDGEQRWVSVVEHYKPDGRLSHVVVGVGRSYVGLAAETVREVARLLAEAVERDEGTS